MAQKAIEYGTGARALRAIFEELMLDVMFEVPSQPKIKKVTITKDSVLGHSRPIMSEE
jgi:ATP-dependent Clp protease ATP-binding subunit ClpX